MNFMPSWWPYYNWKCKCKWRVEEKWGLLNPSGEAWGFTTSLHLCGQMSRLIREVCVSPLDNCQYIMRGLGTRLGGGESHGSVREMEGWGCDVRWRLTRAHVELWTAHAVVSDWTVVETLPILPHPLPPQKQEEFWLAVHTPIVSGAHRAAFTDGVRSIASCGIHRTDRTDH